MTESNQTYNPFTYQFSFNQLGTIFIHYSPSYLPSFLAQSFLQERQEYEPTEVLLFKKIPYNATELDVVKLCKPFGQIEDVCLIRTKAYAFIQFKVLTFILTQFLKFLIGCQNGSALLRNI